MLAARDPRIGTLPPTMQPVAHELGYDLTVAFIAAFAGQEIYVPRAPRFRQRIWQACGPETARALAACYGGENLVVPVARDLTTRAKHAAIRQDPRSANQIAADYGMNVRSVVRIRAGRQTDPRQTDLFERE